MTERSGSDVGRAIGLITARGGSRGVPRKNVRIVCGKPLIAWTLEAALACPELEAVFVSTDDDEIARVAEGCGASNFLERPAALATDEAEHQEVLADAAGRLTHLGYGAPDLIVLLQPTSPLRDAEDISAAVTLARSKGGDVVSVTEAATHPHLAVRVLDDGTVSSFTDVGSSSLRRQALPPAFAPNGAVYVYRWESAAQPPTKAPVYAYVMPPERSVDIDSELDLEVADMLLRQNRARATD